jgi:hypothetical protein
MAVMISSSIKKQATTGFIIAYLWILMMISGGILFETLIVYPNIFYDVPQSLEDGLEFMTVTTPREFFVITGILAMITGIGSLVLMARRRIKWSIYWTLSSLIIFMLGKYLFSYIFFWPLNTILFIEGTIMHSTSYLKQISPEFYTGQWLRLAASEISSILSFIGLLRYIGLK